MTIQFPEGQAIVFCEGAFNTPNGKTAHGLVRRTRRYELLSIIDSNHAGSDAGEVLDGRPAGVPVVAFSAGGLVEAVADGVTGLLVPPEDAAALRDAIARLVDDDQLRQRMGRAGRERMKKDFSIDTMARKHVDVYESVIYG